MGSGGIGCISTATRNILFPLIPLRIGLDLSKIITSVDARSA